MRELTPRQRAFCEAFDGNATQTYLKIYNCGSEISAANSAAKLLRKPEIQEAIQTREKKTLDKLTMDREELFQLWSSIARDESKPTGDRLKASELLARGQMLFVERQQVEAIGMVLPLDALTHLMKVKLESKDGASS